ncbi:MAG TPA: GNAT family N-acetyltransferase, partial [Ilumatobacter sp.]|nr:GNAT family N-acetyltransferase [Ilumatobacter sp.]
RRHDGFMKTTTNIQLVTNPPSTEPDQPCRIVAADHPALDRDVDAFFGVLNAERRYFGPTASANPKPFPSLLRALMERDGFRLAAIECGHVVGLVRIDQHGEMHIAVLADFRGLGIGTLLGKAALDRAIALDYSRVVMRTTRRSKAARRAGEAMGCVVVENARGRTDLIAHLPNGLRSA